jgi:DNA-binding beta-propeller fold protein YncE
VSGGTIQVFDGNTHQSLSTITGCAGVFDWVIDQVFGRIYAGCGRQATTGVLDGDGKIRVIDTGSDAITAVIDLGTTGISFFKLAIDRTRHSVWISHQRASGPQIAMIDVPTNAVSFVDTYGAGVYGSVSVNETTNKAYVVSTQYGTVQEIDGNTFAISRSLSPPYGQAVQSGINRREDKLYVKTIGGPGGRPTVCIYNMSQALPACVPIAGNDWGGIVTNETTNLVYVGVEVGDRIGVVDGASDRLVAEIPMDPATGVSGSTNQSHAVVANETTNHSFFVNRGFLLALDGPTRLTRRLAYSNASPGGGGLLAQAVAINRSNNRVYVVYDGTRVGKVAVFQDR